MTKKFMSATPICWRNTAACFIVMACTLPLALSPNAGSVHAQTVSSSAAPEDDSADRIARWIGRLGHEKFSEREIASKALAKAGQPAIRPLADAVAESPDREIVARSFDLLGKFVNGPHAIQVMDAGQALKESELSLVRRRAEMIIRLGREGIVSQMEALGAQFTRDRSLRVIRVDFDKPWRGTDEQVEHLDRLPYVHTIDCEGSTISDNALRHFARVDSLEKIYLGRSDVTGTGIKHLIGHERLTYLSLIHKTINEEAFEHLGQMVRLKQLGLEDTGLTDAKLLKLSELRELETLWLTNADITDDGLAVLKNFPKLSHLVLEGISISGAGLKHLEAATQMYDLSLSRVPLEKEFFHHVAALDQLTSLKLEGTPVDDETVAQLKGNEKLQKLWLNGTSVTEDAIETFDSLSGLTQLYLPPNRFSKEAIAEIRKNNPRCRVRIYSAPVARR